MSDTNEYRWDCHPEAETLLRSYLFKCCESNEDILRLQKDLLKKTSTDLFHWVDHFIIGHDSQAEKDLRNLGFKADDAGSSYRVFRHYGAMFPAIVLQDSEIPKVAGVGVKVDDIHDFLQVQGYDAEVEGAPFSAFRRSCVSSKGGVTLWVVERRGSLTMEPSYPERGHIETYFAAKELWKKRYRETVPELEEECMYRTMELAEELVQMLGKDMAAHVVMECEREYWQARNYAAQVQKGRQDSVGVGWANHDHHTFRSSRRFMRHLVRTMEILGFHCREGFHAGEQAGWGAQVVENWNCGVTCFLDLDMDPEEVDTDYSSEPLEELDHLRTVGLWCALHGDSLLRGGMHHLECKFRYEVLEDDLASHGIEMMSPFANLPYLKQGFTKGEVWKIEPQRVEWLLNKQLITEEQGFEFLKNGAVGSHLENLERKSGYKGFSQSSVSDIMQRLDPRLESSKKSK
ncbi:MAG: hypothetical protein CMO81_08185 [Waddliaceae bacterium]|nr:hypothetical protein [Waddliaceae bacterium]